MDPAWIRPWDGSNVIRPVGCGGRSTLIEQMPKELKACLDAGSHTTLMVWADVDDNPEDCDALKSMFWNYAQRAGVGKDDFEKVVFVFAKDRLENWVEFLLTGRTSESVEGPRVKYPKQAADAAKALADRFGRTGGPALPPSLEWSCKNWRTLMNRMRD